MTETTTETETKASASDAATDAEPTIDLAAHFEVIMATIMTACGRAVAEGWQGFPTTGACFDAINEHHLLVRDAISREDAADIVTHASGLAAIASLVAVQALIASGLAPDQARAQLTQTQNGVPSAVS